jgi:carboxymethylenebutenolidase
MEAMMKGKMIEFEGNGETYQGYLSAAAQPAPGIIVIQEWWGLVDHIKDVCDRFAAEGFSALSPDLYKGKKTKSPDEAGKMLMALNIAESEKILRGAIDALLSDPGSSSKTAGVVGFCMGGQLALFAAATNPDKVSACVDFYGVHPNVHPPIENLKAPVLGFFAGNDRSVNAEVVTALSRKLSDAGKQHEFHTYKGADHAFFNDTRPEVYKREASEDAWKRTLQFLRQQVK